MTISIYIHIPFCISKCRYCDFYSVALDDYSIVNQYINALGEEWKLYKNSSIMDGMYIDTVYIGGGTPSLLNVDAWELLDKLLFSSFDKSQLKEWSVECNPESFTVDKARMYAGSGVTRLTFGVQSLNAKELSICGRAHSAERALEVLNDNCLNELFDSVGVDIIYALPGQTVNTLDNTLSSVLSIPAIKHLSAYELTIAENTPFGRRKKILPLPLEELTVNMYELINGRCAERGMRQYEVSNYALPGFESRHNKAYWSHKPYIGLGASAHSYIQPKRWSNIANVNQYVSAMLSKNSTISNKSDISQIIPDKSNMPTIISNMSDISPIIPNKSNISQIIPDKSNISPIIPNKSNIPPTILNKSDIPPISYNKAIDFEETLSPPELSREIIFLGLRGADGIDEDDFFNKTGTELLTNGRDILLQKYTDSGLVKQSGKKWLPTPRGMLFADMMAREL